MNSGYRYRFYRNRQLLGVILNQKNTIQSKKQSNNGLKTVLLYRICNSILRFVCRCLLGLVCFIAYEFYHKLLTTTK